MMQNLKGFLLRYVDVTDVRQEGVSPLGAKKKNEVANKKVLCRSKKWEKEVA